MQKWVVKIRRNGAAVCLQDWKLFRSVVCTDLDQPSFPETLNVSQWISVISPAMYQIEADHFDHASDKLIFLSVCEDSKQH